MKKLALLMFVISSFVASPVMGVNVNSSDFYLKACKENINLIEKKPTNIDGTFLCSGFIKGATSMNYFVLSDRGLKITNKKVNDLGLYFCEPFESTIGQQTRIWVKYLEENPQELNSQPILTFIKAMQKAFPCPKE